MRPPVLWIGMTLLALASLAMGYWNHSRPHPRSTTMGPESFYSATASALQDTALRSRGESLTAIFELARPEDLDEITRAFEQTHSGSGPGRLGAELLGELWARHDPDRALERSGGWEAFWRQQFVLPLMNAWARRDGAASQERVSTLGNEKLRNSAERVVAHGRFEARGEAGWEGYWSDWPFGHAVLHELLARVARREGFDPLIDRIEQLPDAVPEDFRARASQGAARLGGRIDPVRTARFVETQADSALDGVSGLAVPLVDSWAQTDARAAMEWLLTQPPGPLRDTAMAVGYRRWSHDATAMREPIQWFESQPEEIQAPLLESYARALVRVDPERAIAAAERIEGENRERVLKRIERMVRARSEARKPGPRIPQPKASAVELDDDDSDAAPDDPSSAALRLETP